MKQTAFHIHHNNGKPVGGQAFIEKHKVFAFAYILDKRVRCDCPQQGYYLYMN